jgi:hypothetical protein
MPADDALAPAQCCWPVGPRDLHRRKRQRAVFRTGYATETQ